MGTLGVPEMMVIFLLALVLFGPKKLPELGRTLGKALTEFRRASSDLKSSFEREMQNLERESDSLKQATHSTVNEIASHVNFDPYNEDAVNYPPVVPHDIPAAINPSTVSASEVPGAESHGTTETASAVAALPPVEGTVPRSESTEPAQQHS